MAGPASSKIIEKDARGGQVKSYDQKGRDQQVPRKREQKMNEKLQELIEKEKKMSINEFLHERELKLQNRNMILQSTNSNFLKVLQLGYERIQASDT